MGKYLNSLYRKKESTAHPLFLSEAITASETKQKNNPQTLSPNPTFLTVSSLIPLLKLDVPALGRRPPPPPPSTAAPPYTLRPPPSADPGSTFLTASVSPRANRNTIGSGDGDLAGESPGGESGLLVFSCSGEDLAGGETVFLDFSCSGEDPWDRELWWLRSEEREDSAAGECGAGEEGSGEGGKDRVGVELVESWSWVVSWIFSIGFLELGGVLQSMMKRFGAFGWSGGKE